MNNLEESDNIKIIKNIEKEKCGDIITSKI